jgi:hypothetical protein
MHHRLHVITGEAQLVAEEERANEWQFLEFCQANGILQELPLRLERIELVDELLGIRQEIVIVIFVPAWKIRSQIDVAAAAFLKNVPQAVRLGLSGLGHLLGVDQMPGTPVALDKTPGPGHIYCIPRVPEPVVLKLNTGLITGRLTVTLDDHAVQSSITAKNQTTNCKRSWSGKCH